MREDLLKDGLVSSVGIEDAIGGIQNGDGAAAFVFFASDLVGTKPIVVGVDFKNGFGLFDDFDRKFMSSDQFFDLVLIHFGLDDLQDKDPRFCC